MRITNLEVRNFRGLERIRLPAGPGLNVIVGPNAIGKTTILEAIRLSKTVLAQRYAGEAQQVLVSLGAYQLPAYGGAQGAQFAPLCGDPARPVQVSLHIKLDDIEFETITTSVSALALMMLQTELARSNVENSVDLTQYLSTIEGQGRLAANTERVTDLLGNLTKDTTLKLDLVIDVQTDQIRGTDPDSQMFITLLERSITPSKAHFNYFVADRALPAGEVAIQLGSADIQQQVMSYMSQPSLKYGRLKLLIIQIILLDPNGRDLIKSEFDLIFDNLLPGKKLSGVSYNEHGILKVLVEDTSTKKVFDIDSMSSGEKGLVLTFLTLRLNAKPNSIVMLDEPELHLNAAVCSRIVRFLVEHCVKSMGLQIFICSHSPEIVRDAFESVDCKLFHLRSNVDLSPVLQQDNGEVFEILNRLGTNTADVLFSKGSIFVEGEHDASILQAGYPALLSGYKVLSTGGRSEVEKEIGKLQTLESEGKLDKKQLFIFDNDRKKTPLKSTALVHVNQLQRYCIENYLLDETILFDVIHRHAPSFTESRGTFPTALEGIAISQLDTYVIRTTYQALEPENAGLRPKDIRSMAFDQAAIKLWDQIEKVRASVVSLDKSQWIADFIAKCETTKTEIEPNWKSKWRELASGKQIIDDLYAIYNINIAKLDFKREVMAKMAEEETDLWRILDSVLSKELA